MSGARLLHLADAEALDRLEQMVAACHAETGHTSDAETRRAALEPLLDGSPHGAVWLIGPRRSPVGYVIVTFGWSVAEGGLCGTMDDIFIRKAVRGRGMATEALAALQRDLAASGLRSLYFAVESANERALALCTRRGFSPRGGHRLMSWRAPA